MLGCTFLRLPSSRSRHRSFHPAWLRLSPPPWAIMDHSLTKPFASLSHGPQAPLVGHDLRQSEMCVGGCERASSWIEKRCEQAVAVKGAMSMNDEGEAAGGYGTRHVMEERK